MPSYASLQLGSASTKGAGARVHTTARRRAMNARALTAATLLITLSALASLVPGRAQAASFHIVSDGTAKYSYTEEPGWETLGFNDSAWPFVVAPSIGLCGEPAPVPPGAPEPIWGENPQEFQRIFVRKTFTLNAAATANIIAGADDDYELFINGELIGGSGNGNPGLYTEVPLQVGLNVLAMEAVDTFGGCQSLTFEVFPPPEPPANDDVADAIVIPALPFTDMRDTRGATTAPDDPSGCFGDMNNVWYAFTPSEDTVVRLSSAGSSYEAFMDVFVSSAGELNPTGACSSGQLDFVAIAGTTYYIMVSSPFGGDLVFAALNLGPPFLVTLSLDTIGLFDPITGSATIGGTVTCTEPARVDVFGQLRQKFFRRLIVQGDFFTSVGCDGETPWSAIVRSSQAAFGWGYAEILASVSGCGPINCDDDQADAIIRLFPSSD